MKQNVTANQTRGILMTFYINARQTDSVCKISGSLRQCILHYRNNWSELVFLCIGTDRVTGDCLGPFVLGKNSVVIPEQFFLSMGHCSSLFMP